MTDFGVETIELDLPPLVGALSRRLRDAGLPTTPARAADFARALDARPADRAPAAVLDRPRRLRLGPGPGRGLRRGVLLGLRQPRRKGEELVLEDPQTVASPLDKRSSSPPSERDEDEEPAEVEVPLALASDEELLGARASTRSSRTSSRSSTG